MLLTSLIVILGVLSGVTVSVVTALEIIVSASVSWMALQISCNVFTEPIFSVVKPSHDGICFSSSEIISTFLMESMPRSDSIFISASSISTGKPVNVLTISNRVCFVCTLELLFTGLSSTMGSIVCDS